MSSREQSGLHNHGSAVLESLHLLNQAYEDAFPGLIFVYVLSREEGRWKDDMLTCVVQDFRKWQRLHRHHG